VQYQLTHSLGNNFYAFIIALLLATLASLGLEWYDRKKMKKHPRTNVIISDKELWNLAQYPAKQLGKESVSGCLFDLIKEGKS
jgi:hypothetical protein